MGLSYGRVLDFIEGVAAPVPVPFPLSGGRITSLNPMSAAPRNTESPSDAATSALNNGCSRATGIAYIIFCSKYETFT